MLVLLRYLITHEHLPPIAGPLYLLIGTAVAIMIVWAIGWRQIRESSSVLRPIAVLCAVAAEWPLIVVGFFVFACIEEWRRRG